MKHKIVTPTSTILPSLTLWAATLAGAVGRRLARRLPRPVGGDSRGDVPGWVLITLMSAVLVAGLLAIAGPALEGLFNQAMEQVKP